MDLSRRAALREFVSTLLRRADDPAPFSDSTSLFVSGRLDSLSAVEVVTFLEDAFGVDLAEDDFAIDRIDSIDAIGVLIGEQGD
jgi:acyl carrier protein